MDMTVHKYRAFVERLGINKVITDEEVLRRNLFNWFRHISSAGLPRPLSPIWGFLGRSLSPEEETALTKLITETLEKYFVPKLEVFVCEAYIDPNNLGLVVSLRARDPKTNTNVGIDFSTG